ncbi:hypothetical protein RND81_01G075800 [Saponaria officinalis]|uniref:Uncharacterized protein n=1 Tax=Saponaria officinalis TaxID=3572 RepID=A0AAW1NDQ5_SAPOF
MCDRDVCKNSEITAGGEKIGLDHFKPIRPLGCGDTGRLAANVEERNKLPRRLSSVPISPSICAHDDLTTENKWRGATSFFEVDEVTGGDAAEVAGRNKN